MSFVDTLTARRKVLINERQQRGGQHIIADRQTEQQLDQLDARRMTLHEQREAAQRQWEKDDHAYGALIGELDTLITQAEAADAAELTIEGSE